MVLVREREQIEVVEDVPKPKKKAREEIGSNKE